MSFPNGMQTFTVTFGPASTLVLGTDLAMRVSFLPSTSAVWAATGKPLVAYAETVTSDVGGQGSATLPSPDQAGFVDGQGSTVRNWTYRADIDYLLRGTVIGSTLKVFTYTAGSPSPFDLDLVIPVSTSAGVTVSIPDAWSAAAAASPLNAKAYGLSPAATADANSAAFDAWAADLVATHAEGFIPAGTYSLNPGRVISSSTVRVRGAGAGDTILAFTGSGSDLLTVGDGSGGQVRPTGYLCDLAVIGPTAAPTSGHGAVVINGLNQFEVDSVRADNQDIGFDLINNCYGTQFANIRAGFGGSVNVGVNLRSGPQSGSDLSFYDPWVAGKIAGFHVSGGGGGYHIYGGQVGAGLGTSSPNDDAGALILGKDYLTGALAETSVDLHGVSFENANETWVFRGYDQCVVNGFGLYANPAASGTPAIGFFKHSNAKQSRFAFHGTTLSGNWSAAALVSIAGSYGGTFWTETSTYTAAQNPVIAGAGTYVSSLAEQSGITDNAVVISSGGLIASSTKLGGPAFVSRNLYSANQASAVTDSSGLAPDQGTNSVARDTGVTPDPGRDPASWIVTATGGGNARSKANIVPVPAFSTVTARLLAISDTTARNMRIEIDWLNSGNGYIGSTQPNFVSTYTDRWEELIVVGTAPAGAVKAQVNLVISNAGTAESFHVARQKISTAG